MTLLGEVRLIPSPWTCHRCLTRGQAPTDAEALTALTRHTAADHPGQTVRGTWRRLTLRLVSQAS